MTSATGKTQNTTIGAYGFYILYGILCFGSLFLQCDKFNDTDIVPKQYFCGGFLAILGLWIVAGKKPNGLLSSVDPRILNHIALSCVVLQALYATIYYTHNSSHLAGSFDNSAGLAAVVCGVFPFTLVRLKPLKGRVASVILAIFLLFVLIVSQSRAGVLAVSISLLLAFAPKLQIRKSLKISLGIFVVLITVTVLYFIKKDSADGRLLIWQCCAEMFLQRPVTGWGMRGFLAHYMDFQAQYLTRHPDHPWALLADNIHQPFNEWIGLVVRFGLIGCLTVFVFLIFLCKSYREGREMPECRAALNSLISLSVFACFSYPFIYSFTWIVILSDIFAICHYGDCFAARNASTIALVFRSVVAVGCLAALLWLGVKVRNELQWNETAMRAQRGQTEVAINEYEHLSHKTTLSRDPYFLYNYAAELNIAGQYRLSLDKALTCRKLWADYDLELLIAQDFEEVGEWRQAIEHYQNAAAMCPCRFYPPYAIAQLYISHGMTLEAKDIAQSILDKSVKIPSGTVSRIRSEMRQFLDTAATDAQNTEY